MQVCLLKKIWKYTLLKQVSLLVKVWNNGSLVKLGSLGEILEDANSQASVLTDAGLIGLERNLNLGNFYKASWVVLMCSQILKL